LIFQTKDAIIRLLHKDGPAEATHSPGPGPQKGLETVDTKESSAPPAHPSTEETPHACLDGWVYIGYMVESKHDLDGEVVVYARVPCRRCADSK
jgi:hypothetical protein